MLAQAVFDQASASVGSSFTACSNGDGAVLRRAARDSPSQGVAWRLLLVPGSIGRSRLAGYVWVHLQRPRQPVELGDDLPPPHVADCGCGCLWLDWVVCGLRVSVAAGGVDAGCGPAAVRDGRFSSLPGVCGILLVVVGSARRVLGRHDRFGRGQRRRSGLYSGANLVVAGQVFGLLAAGWRAAVGAELG